MNFIKDFEGFSTTCKRDSKQNSWGYGTKCTQLGSIIDRETAMVYKKQHLEPLYEIVDNSCYTDNQKISLVSYMYNVGVNAMNIKHYVQKCDKKSILYIMNNYGHTINGVWSKGLAKRRNIEIEKFQQ